jgi:mono/diheme cytochrome c family protein
MNTKALGTLVGSLALGAMLGSTSAARAADPGQQAFEANKCSNCHSVEKLGIARKIQSEKMAGPDMSTIGDKHDADWIMKWTSRQIEKDGKQHKNEYKGTKEDLQTIATWLASLKSS